MNDFMIKVFLSAICAFFGALFYIIIGDMYDMQTKVQMTYDCRLAEISPDYPQAVRNKCREIMQ